MAQLPRPTWTATEVLPATNVQGNIIYKILDGSVSICLRLHAMCIFSRKVYIGIPFFGDGTGGSSHYLVFSSFNPKKYEVIYDHHPEHAKTKPLYVKWKTVFPRTLSIYIYIYIYIQYIHR